MKATRITLATATRFEFGNIFYLASWAIFTFSPQAIRFQIAVFEFIFVCKLFKSDLTQEVSQRKKGKQIAAASLKGLKKFRFVFNSVQLKREKKLGGLPWIT